MDISPRAELVAAAGKKHSQVGAWRTYPREGEKARKGEEDGELSMREDAEKTEGVAHHRARLLHSTRKLADVLGAIPLVLDAPKTDRRTRRNGSVFEFAFDPPVCVSPSDPRAHLAPALTPSPCASVFPPSPDADAACVRRRRMAKLARTLGENVPAELVFPARARRRSASMGAIVFAPSPVATAIPPPASAPAPMTTPTAAPAPISSPRPLKPAPRPLPSLPARPTARTAVRPLPLPTQRAPLPDLWRELPSSSCVQTTSSRVQTASSRVQPASSRGHAQRERPSPLPVGVKPKSADSASYHTAKAPSSYYTAPRSAVPSSGSRNAAPSARSAVPSSYHTAASSLSSLPSSLPSSLSSSPSSSHSSPISSRSSSRSATPTSDSESESMYAPSETPPSSAPTSRVGTPVSRACSPAVSRACSPAVSAVCPPFHPVSPSSSRAVSPVARACSPAISAVCPRAPSPATPSSSRAPTPSPDAPFSWTLSPSAARAELLAAASNRKQSWVGAWRMESDKEDIEGGGVEGDGELSMREVQRRLRALR
ncbi:hypothetical protein PLICRDRAFT_177790 [Plicaturopsis crispa FD-325 SS-3]|nr:hypothetical protein PLICRDRAFT_177790 [Plicaturopsis crispa FD-325 SS-3]